MTERGVCNWVQVNKAVKKAYSGVGKLLDHPQVFFFLEWCFGLYVQKGKEEFHFHKLILSRTWSLLLDYPATLCQLSQHKNLPEAQVEVTMISMWDMRVWLATYRFKSPHGNTTNRRRRTNHWLNTQYICYDSKCKVRCPVWSSQCRGYG